MNKFTLYLMNKKGLAVLNGIINGARKDYIHCVVGAKDPNVRNDYYNEIKTLCIKNDITFYVRGDCIIDSSNFQIAIGWRWLIKDSSRLIVLHDSILPRYRGFAPLVNYLINGENEIGVTALYASEKYDRGDILKQAIIKINYPIKIETAIDIVSKEYSNIVKYIIDNIDNIKPFSQDESKASYSLWRDSLDYYICWDWSSCRIKRFVDALGYPYNGAKCTINGDIFTILDVEEVQDIEIENRDAGKVIFIEENSPIVVCGKGLIKINKMFNSEGEQLKLSKFRTRFGGDENTI